ncbi:MAG: Type 1 glutamine amidotransferase-like domain-containing protein [Rickettsiales bacterium]|jgi:dipeptidase E|nr:Type 1 glutamine amidotransferase-like domain-containing protein [Rickettsiales bacterium]
MKIVAIGGGEIGRKNVMPDGSVFQYPVETIEIEQKIIRLTEKKNPKLLLLATAANDSEIYLDTVERHFGERLGCMVSWLQLATQNPTENEIQKAILETDIIYVGGGNTNKMIQIWKDKGADKVLKQALDSGVILSGISAGANCWFKHYSTDSLAIDAGVENGTMLSIADGLGFINGVCVPHTMSEPARVPYAKEMLMTKYPNDVFYGIDDFTALIFENGKMRSLVSATGKEKGAKVRRLSMANGQVVESVISTTPQPFFEKSDFCR